MVWWQWSLIYVGIVIAAMLLSLLISYVILRIQHRPWPFSRIFSRKYRSDIRLETFSNPETLPDNFIQNNSEPVIPEVEIEDDIPSVNIPAGNIAPAPATGTTQSEIIKEIEENLSIASAPRLDKMVPFQTNAWDTKRSELDHAGSDIRLRLAEVYIDISLANRIVWMASEFELKSKDLEEGYLRLCKNIAERLQNILPAL